MRTWTKRWTRPLIVKLVFTVLAFFAMAVLSYVFISSIVRDSLLRNADAVLNFSEARINDGFATARTAMERYASGVRDIFAQEGTEAALNAYLADLNRYADLTNVSGIDIDHFYGYFETLPDGPVLLSGGERRYPGDPADPAPSGAYYLQAVAAEGAVVEVSPYIDRNGRLLATFAQSLSDESGRRLGVVCLDITIDTVAEAIVNTALNQGGYGMLLNSELILLSHPNPAFKGLRADNPAVPISVFYAAFQNQTPVFEAAMQSYQNEPSVAFFRYLPHGLVLGLVTPKAQYYQSTDNMAVVLCVLSVSLASTLCGLLLRLDSERLRSNAESKQKSAFLANMSHEIRTPINAIVGMTTLGKAATNTERKDYCFEKISDASNHLLGVINDILDISKIEANKFELSLASFNFEHMLQHTVNVINFRIEEKKQTLFVYIDHEIPEILFSDDQRLTQVVANLLSNAVKFTPEGGSINLRASLEAVEGDVYTLRITVTDNGIGLSKEQQTRLFQSFQQAELDTTRKYGGTGLGLAISKHIIELMGGRIWVSSVPDKGSTFGFTVKTRRGQTKTAQNARPTALWSTMRLLAIDDDADVLAYFKEIASRFGVQCTVAATAAEALRLIDEEGGFDIYFVDLRMPDTDGIQLTKEIRAKEKTPGVSVVVMISAYDLSIIEPEAKAAGVDKFLLKPLFPSAIADTISECVGTANKKAAEEAMKIDGIFAGRRALLAEDIEINREIVLAMLAPSLLQIDCVENGAEAVRVFSEAPERYDLIFMDIQMPEMDGFEATRQIRALPNQKAKTVPIIAMTANAFKEDVALCLSTGMNDHISKPLDMRGLIELTRRYL